MTTTKQLIEELYRQGIQYQQMHTTIVVIQDWLKEHYPVLAELSKNEWKEIVKCIERRDKKKQ